MANENKNQLDWIYPQNIGATPILDLLELSSKYDDADHNHELHNDHFFKKEE